MFVKLQKNSDKVLKKGAKNIISLKNVVQLAKFKFPYLSLHESIPVVIGSVILVICKLYVVKRSSLFFIKGLNFLFSLLSYKYMAVFNFFNVLKLFFFKNIMFFFFSSSFVYFFFKNFVFFKFLNPFCFIAIPSSLEDFFLFFKDVSSDFFLVGFSMDFFFIILNFF